MATTKNTEGKTKKEILRDALTIRQRRFCEEYIVDYNGTAAARRAGYKAQMLDRQASQLINHPKCKAYYELLDEEKRETLGQSVSVDYVLKKTLEGIAAAEDKGTLSAYFRGLELLARHLGMLKDKTEISGPDGQAIEVAQRTAKEAEEFIDALKSLSKKEVTLL